METKKQDVKDLMSQLLQQKPLKARFKLNLRKNDMIRLLTASYMAEVEFRKRKFIETDEVKDMIEQVAEELTCKAPKFGIMLNGLCGNGKTTLVYALQNAINFLRRKELVQTTGLIIQDADDLLVISKDIKRFQAVRNEELLAIEDLGKEPTEVMEFGTIHQPLVKLLEDRYNKQLFTIVTTNLTPPQITEKYGERIGDRCAEMFKIISLKQKTYRKLNTK